MAPLSLSRRSLTGRLMLAFSVLGLLLLLLVSLGSLSLHWLKQADRYLYEESLPASQAARQLVQASNALSDGVTQLGQVEDERQREFIGRKLNLESATMLNSIKVLLALDVNEDNHLPVLAGQIIEQLTLLGQSVGQRITLGDELQRRARELSVAAAHASELLQSELAVVDSAILAKLSQAYPDMAGNKRSGQLLDDVIERELDIQEQLNRALKLVHQIALLSQLFEVSELQSELQLSVPRLLATFASTLPSHPVAHINQQKGTAIEQASEAVTELSAPEVGIDLMALTTVSELIRDPGRLNALKAELVTLKHTPKIIKLQRDLSQSLQRQQRQQQALAEKLYSLNTLVDSALNQQQQRAELARSDYLMQLSYARFGLLATGMLMFVIMGWVIYRVIYRGIALRLNQATQAMSRLSLGDINVSLDARGDDELTAMANAIEAFKRKTAHNLKLQADLRQVADELTEHKKALEQTVATRTQELAETNLRLDAEAKGHAKARVVAEEASQAKSQFLATMSHEIRTPLNGLLGTLTLLGQSQLPPAQQQMLALSQYSGTLLQTVLSDILDFSRLEQGNLTNEPRPTDINALLDEVLAIMVAGANLAGLSLRLNRPQLPACINIDGPKLRQVLFNLIGNGIKFTSEGSVSLNVSLQGGRLAFVVADTGVGIAPEVREQLFIPYSTLPNQGRSRGTGLGLAICKQLVELMDANGRGIWVKSEPGKGSEFGFELCFTQCDKAQDAQTLVHKQVHTQRVLVVEDNKVNAMVAQGFLAHLGHSSTLAASCQLALECVSADKAFDAVMLDIQLSDGSGVALLPQLKALFGAKNVKFAAFTAQMQMEDLSLYREVGFDTVLAKPLSLQTLTQWLGVAMASSSLETESPGLSASPSFISASSAPLAQATDTSGAIPLGNQATETLLDIEQLQQDIEVLGVKAVSDMLALYKTSSAEQIERLSEATFVESSADSAKLLHALKGSSASMGLKALTQCCQVWEKQLKTTGAQKLEIQSANELRACWLASMTALEQWLVTVE
ncbi:TMAO reductase system sensor histidine kinase/response regulator TorS [Shewanella oneidensis MR-1]|uniref:histidine kinase n=1 Tax=Shewanella oneidensis (strain ATCC 700550 / JCM 31522 / CIP 106686 / LMG 19005 / NCIMB 14063 / MR-1) TaxID=211586 RepID=Q8EHJ1_SHEON|nr:TMAO reductase system sensor histidine kinase/response regulator TorS [Shewanella oneidensis]AAN54298.1 TMAO-responsive two component signal transduction system hybrid histidine kinase/response regulator TorS [Shewanella oneidensis MR-1]MDX5996918.1 TMAO reductase system sensor histidine kinase/response regulator TorS [Shewanella oneidensis]MEE2028187.1 Sensor histidine kinase RcsC [Shewanella oneidensis]QKG96010.1 TMAO reductase system sensor histidine kinase/response regulator TorS [Shewan